jgi:hypothetical protein
VLNPELNPMPKTHLPHELYEVPSVLCFPEPILQTRRSHWNCCKLISLFVKTNQLKKEEEKKMLLLKSGRVKKREKPIGLAAIMRTPTALTASISAAAWPEDGSRWWDTTSRSSSAVSFALLWEPTTCLISFINPPQTLFHQPIDKDSFFVVRFPWQKRIQNLSGKERWQKESTRPSLRAKSSTEDNASQGSSRSADELHKTDLK